MTIGTLYLAHEPDPGHFTHILKHRAAGEIFSDFGGTEQECIRHAEELVEKGWAKGWEYGSPPIEPTFLSIAQEAWVKEGDCELTGWENEPLPYSIAIKAWGIPPRCRKRYLHVFLFKNSWHNGQSIRVLSTIFRAPWHEPVRWMSNGQGYKPSQEYQYFGKDSPYVVS